MTEKMGRGDVKGRAGKRKPNALYWLQMNIISQGVSCYRCQKQKQESPL